MGDDYYVLIVFGAQALSGLVMAVGVVVGLRLALPSLARALVREMEAARHAEGDAGAPEQDASNGPVVTLAPRDELRNGN